MFEIELNGHDKILLRFDIVAIMRLRFSSEAILLVAFSLFSNWLGKNVSLGYVHPISPRKEGMIVHPSSFAPSSLKGRYKWNHKICRNSLQQNDIEDEVDTPLSNEPTILSCRIGDMTSDMIRSTRNIMSYLSSKQDLKAKTLKESDLSQLPAIDLSTPRKNAQLVEDLLDRLLEERDIHTKWDSIINTETFNIVSKSILKKNCGNLIHYNIIQFSLISHLFF